MGRIAMRVLAAVLATAALLHAAPGDRREKEPPTRVAPWKGPARDFKEVDGRIVGEWWQGGGLGVVYYTGPHAQKMKVFEDLGRRLAGEMGRPYLEIHVDDMRPSEKHPKTVIAYPDGSARVRLFLMPGGNSALTMQEITGVTNVVAEREKFAEYRKTPQEAVRTGMNYVGACGGAFTGASGFTVPNSVCTSWGLWPGRCTQIGPGMKKPFPDVVFDKKDAAHPLVRAGAPKGTLKDMFFNGGPLNLEDGVADTEYLGKYVGGAMPEIQGSWFCVVWRPKDNGQSGRVVLATGHPEASHHEFLKVMAEYAVAHEYEVPRRYVEPGQPIEGVAGDDQVQYFCVKAEAKQKLTVSLSGLTENADLYLRFGLPPTFRKYDARSAKPKTADEVLSVTSTRAGDYFIAVHGNHTQTAGGNYELRGTLEGPGPAH